MTEKPNAMKNLNLSHIRDKIMEFANVGFYCYRLDGEIVFMDKGTLNLLDLADVEPRDVIGRNIDSLFVHEHPAGSLRGAARSREKLSHFEYHYRTLSGKERWVYHNAFLVMDPDTGEQLIQVFSQDITDLKLTALALESSERRFRTLAENLPHGIAIVKGEPSRVVFVNPVLCGIIDASPGKLIGAENEMLRMYVHPEDLHGLIKEQGAGRRTGKIFPYREIRILRPDASMRWVLFGAVPTEFDGGPAMLTTLIDITDRKQEEDERRKFEVKLRQTQKLESLSVLAGGIAHDFNNLLAAIIGRCDLALMRPGHDPILQGYLEDVGSAAGKAAELCRSLLAYAGRDPIESKPIGIDALIQETLPLLHIAVPKTARLEYDPDESDLTVMSDKAQLRQVLFNLVANASESLEGKTGAITITTRSVRITRDEPAELYHGNSLPEGLYIRIDVSDTGAGMDSDTLSRIFEPFFTTKFTGRGLGLATVIGIVRGHGGGICVNSAPGGGACFSIYLPLVDAHAPVEEPPVESSAAGWGAGMVLVADDDPSVLETLRSMIEVFGFDILCAADGMQAVDLFLKNAGDITLAVLDIRMPGMNGPDAFRRIRSLRANLPVLFISGFDAQNACSELKHEPGVRFLQKPFRMDTLAMSIKDLLGDRW